MGFFNKSDIAQPVGNMSCISCGLFSSCITPRMKEWGEYSVPVMLIGEAPGETEDRRGIPFCGECGRFLRSVFNDFGYDLSDFIITNAVVCRPPKNRTPRPAEIQACRSRVFSLIENYKPKVIFLIGNAAIQSVIGNYWKKDIKGIRRWRGYTIPIRPLKTWIIPIYHPSYILRNNDNKSVFILWKKDIKKGIECLDRDFDFDFDERDFVEVIFEKPEAINLLKNILREKPKFQAFDYETNGLKPDASGHKIYTVSFSWKRNHAVAVPFFYDDEFLSLFKKILRNGKIKKIASNLKYEERWTRKILGYRVNGWYWDTMWDSHILDNRTEISSIKFQAFIRYGTPDYDSVIHKYLTSETSNDFNRIEKAPLKELLIYNAIDSLLEYKVFEDQKKEMNL